MFGFLLQVFIIVSIIFLATKGYSMTQDYLQRGKLLNELEKKYDELTKRRGKVSVKVS